MSARAKKLYDPTALLFTIVHAARFLGIGERTFYEVRRSPGFPLPVEVPGTVLRMYRRDHLEAWVRSLASIPGVAA